MPRAVIEISIEIPNISVTLKIKCCLPALAYDQNPIWRNLVIRMLLNSIYVIFVVSDNIIFNLKHPITIVICYISIQERPSLLELDPN